MNNIFDWTQEHGERAKTARNNAPRRNGGKGIPEDVAFRRLYMSSVNVLREVEAGTRAPSEKHLHNMASIYDVDTDYLLLKQDVPKKAAVPQAPEQTESIPAQNNEAENPVDQVPDNGPDTEAEKHDTDKKEEAAMENTTKKTYAVLPGENVGERLKNRREQLGYSKSDVQAMTNDVMKSLTTLSRYERGVSTVPYDVLAALARIYKRRPEQFATEEELEVIRSTKCRGGYTRTGTTKAVVTEKAPAVKAEKPAAAVPDTVNDENIMVMAAAVKAAREASGMSISDVASAAGLSEEKCTQMEAGTFEIGLSEIVKIAPVIKLSLTTIINDICPGRWVKYVPSDDLDCCKLLGWCKKREKEIETRPVNNWEYAELWTEDNASVIEKEAVEAMGLEGFFE